jgi:predicted nucleic acid-binding protein
LLDTSFLVALLVKNDPIHPLAVAVCMQSAKGNIPIYYSNETKAELWRFIDGSRSEMNNGLISIGNPKVIISQFVKDFIRLKGRISWAEYATELSNWEQVVKMNWNVSQLSPVPDLDESAYFYVKQMLPLLNQYREGPQIEHDACCLGMIAGVRKTLETPVSIGPWFLTFDNSVFAVSEFYHHLDKQHFGLAIQPRRFLNYLITFAKTEFSESDRNEVAKAILLHTARTESPKLELADYTRLIAPKIGFESESTELLMELFLKSPLRLELERAIEQDHGGDAERIVQKIITDEKFVKDIIDHSQKTKDLVQARQTITKLQSKLRESETARRDLQRIAEQRINIEVVTTVELNLQAKINGLISQLESELPNGFRAYGLPEPPKVVTRIGKLKSWLTELKDAIDASNTVTEGVKKLLPYIVLLIDSLKDIQH